jgi:hypothetical protein
MVQSPFASHIASRVPQDLSAKTALKQADSGTFVVSARLSVRPKRHVAVVNVGFQTGGEMERKTALPPEKKARIITDAGLEKGGLAAPSEEKLR